MDNFVRIDRIRRRVFIRAQGQWTIPQAELYHVDMQGVLSWARKTGEPISVFADLKGLVVHTADVAKRLESAVQIMADFPIRNYALIVPSHLMRMQCRRLLKNIPHVYFEDERTALSWLGWEATYAMAA